MAHVQQGGRAICSSAVSQVRRDKADHAADPDPGADREEQ